MIDYQTNKQNKKNTLPTWASIILLLLFSIPTILALLIPVVGPRDESILENRTLQQFPTFTLLSFKDGSFQDDLEDALIDQLPLMEPIKETVLDGKNELLKLQQEILYAANPDLRSQYSLIADGYYHFAGDDHRIVEKPGDYTDYKDHLEELAANLSKLSGVKRYVYFVENSRSVSFENPDHENRIYNEVVAAIQPEASDLFKVPDYQTYCEYFYQTDHHWNYKGSYEAYKEIHRLLHGTDHGVIEPRETITTDVIFQGSYARQTHDLCANEAFTFQTFDLPNYSTQINGRRRAYGNETAYEKGKYSKEPLANHYANCFGGDFGEIIYDFGSTGRGRLLIIASS